MEKKCCRNCKHAHQTFGNGLKEELQLWECTATIGIAICEDHSHVPISLNHYCDWWNATEEIIVKDVQFLRGKAEERRRMQKGVCLGKIVKDLPNVMVIDTTETKNPL